MRDATVCPSEELLRRSLDLDDPMTEQERQHIEEHVGHCAAKCKQAIDALLRGNTLMLVQDRTQAVNRSSVTATAMPDEAELVVPGYELLGELGRGGMGVVYRARQLALDRVVALKMLLRPVNEAEAEDYARFTREALAVASLNHSGIVQIYELGRHGDRPFIAMELVEGGNLSERLAGVPQPPQQAAALVARLADAVQAAHRQQIIHRDLKPANILVAADGTPKITDFGLAKRLDVESTESVGKFLGTASYAAPEQALGRLHEVGPATDVYGLGAILYEMLTGRPPFRAASTWETLQQVVGNDPVSPSCLAAVPRDLETICLKAMAKEPARRYPTAADLAADLRRFVDGEPIQARPVGVTEKLWRRVRRNPALFGLTVVVILLGGMVVGVLATRPRPEPGLPVGPTAGNTQTDPADDLVEVVAELDRTDPDWRLEQVEAKRKVIPDDQNGALQIAAFRKLAVEVRDGSAGDGQGTVNPIIRERMQAPENQPPRSRLSEADVTLFRTELKRLERALPLARKMKEYPSGRFRINYARDAYSTNLTAWSAGRHLADLLRLDALVQIQDRNRPDAVTSCLALLNVGRAYVDEPLAHVQWQGMIVFHQALQVLERLMAQADCTDAELEAFQRVLMEVAAVPVLVTMARGDRGAHHYFLSSLAAGDQPDSSILQSIDIKSRSELPSGKDIRRFHAWLLRYYTEFLAIARQPPEKQPPLLKVLDEKSETAPLAGTPLFKALTRISVEAAAVTRQLAELRCATVALAVERYRFAHGEWPRDLAATVPAYMKEVPKDPYDGLLLRYRRTTDGVVVYCLGPDQTDNQGKLDRTAITTVPAYLKKVSMDPYLKEVPKDPSDGVDVGFQLWDAAKRR